MIKKIIKRILIAILIFFPLSIFLFSDTSQYKKIGDTNFYLVPNAMGEESFLYHDGGHEGGYSPIYHKGIVHDAYWNKQYVIIKCSEKEEENWYIIRNIKEYYYSKFKILHFLNEKDYKNALDSLGINEAKMEHTDGSIPWSLHLW